MKLTQNANPCSCFPRSLKLQPNKQKYLSLLTVLYLWPGAKSGSWQYCKLKEGFQGLSSSKAY
jgi:hypothetical protein